MESAVSYQAKAKKALKDGHVETAIDLYKQAIIYAEQENDLERLGALHQQFGLLYAKRDNWAEAALHFAEAANIASQLGAEHNDKAMQTRHQASEAFRNLALSNAQGSESNQDAFHDSINSANKLIAFAQTIKDAKHEAIGWAIVANCQQGLGKYNASAESFNQAIVLMPETKYRIEIAEYWLGLGHTHSLAGNLFKAEKAYLQGVATLDKKEQLISRWEFDNEQSKPREQKTIQHKKRSIFNRFHRYSTEQYLLASQLCEGLATNYLAKYKLKQAQHYATQALNLVQFTEDTYSKANLLSTQALILRQMGDYETAVSLQKQTIEQLLSAPQKQAQHQVSNEIGNLVTTYQLMGHYQNALEITEEWLPFIQENANVELVAKWHDTIGANYEELGQFNTAINHYKQAIHLLENNNLPERVCALTRNSLGIAYYRQAMFHPDTPAAFENAKQQYDEAYRLAEIAQESVLQATIKGNLGLVYMQLKQLAQAEQNFLEAQAVLQENEQIIASGHQHENLGTLYGQYLNDFDKAEDHYKKAINIARTHQDRDAQRIALTRLGDLYRQEPRREKECETCYKNSIAILEEQRSTLSISAHRSGLLYRNLDAYEGLVRYYWQANDHQSAFNWAEQARARAFVEQVSLSAQLPHNGIPANLIDKEAALLNKARQYDQALILDAQNNIEKTTNINIRERHQTQTELDELWQEIEQLPGGVGEKYATLRRGKSTTADSLQSWLDSQSQNTAVLVFYTFPEEIFTWLFVSNKAMIAEVIPISQTKLEYCLRRFEAEFFHSHEIDLTWPELLTPLFSTFRSNAIDEYKNYQAIYIVPHGLLHQFPLHVIKIENDSICEKIPIAYLPNNGLLLRRPPTKSGHSHAAIAIGYTSSLDLEEKEIFSRATKNIAKEMNAIVIIGDEAKKTTLLQATENATIISILAHGYFKDLPPLESHIILQDGKLSAREILNLNLSNAIVILNACQVGRSHVHQSDEIMGFAHAFLLAGASTVLAAQWNVQASSAIKLVSYFYQYSQKENQSMALSLQNAMTQIRNENPHPYYWAPFSLIGKAN